jgi:muramoyltetrapeptide carboxypeptidase
MRDPVTLLRPRALVPGDRVAVVAPSSRYDSRALARGMAVLESWGLVAEPPAAGSRLRNLAGSDDERAAALTEAFERDDVAAVMAVRGGYGAARLQGRFDAAVAASHPKIFLGYSDLSIVLGRLVSEAGLVCFHGPMVSSDLARLPVEALEPFRRFLFGEEGWWTGSGLTGRSPGSATGRLVGGCLSVIATTIGTPYEIDTRGGVLFLEDIGEKPYKIDRLLTQLAHAGKLDEVRAVVLGTFHDCDTAGEPGVVMEVADEILGSLGVPVLSGFDAGHYSGGGIVPMGCEVRVDADAGTIDLLEPVFAGAAIPRGAAETSPGREAAAIPGSAGAATAGSAGATTPGSADASGRAAR